MYIKYIYTNCKFRGFPAELGTMFPSSVGKPREVLVNTISFHVEVVGEREKRLLLFIAFFSFKNQILSS